MQKAQPEIVEHDRALLKPSVLAGQCFYRRRLSTTQIGRRLLPLAHSLQVGGNAFSPQAR